MLLAKNKLTGLYFRISQGFTASKHEASVLSPQEAAVVKASYLNVEMENTK